MKEQQLAKDIAPSLIGSAGEESSFDDIRPYKPEELPQVFDELMADEQFVQAVSRVMPDVCGKMKAFLKANEGTSFTNLDVQKTFIYPLVQHIIATCTQGIDLSVPEHLDRQQPHTFITNHRDIVLDSAFLSFLLVENQFPTTVEIAIGDNLLIFPWIKKLVRINKSFIVQRSLSMREMLRASQTMSRYMHYAIAEKHENIWIAQREGRAKDSDDRTQDSILKMMAMGGEGTIIDRLRQLHLTPMALSYEYDPCDYLKAKEFQQRRDIPDFKKSKADDLASMQTGIFGAKGHIHFAAAPCIDEWLDTLDPATPKLEIFPLIARHIDQEIHRNFRLYPSNLIAAALLTSTSASSVSSNRFSPADLSAFEDYLQQRIALAANALQAEGLQPDPAYLRERLLTMYANPVFNQEKAK